MNGRDTRRSWLWHSPLAGWGLFAASAVALSVLSWSLLHSPIALPPPRVTVLAPPVPQVIVPPASSTPQPAEPKPAEVQPAAEARSNLQALSATLAQEHTRVVQLESDIQTRDSQLAQSRRDLQDLQTRLASSSHTSPPPLAAGPDQTQVAALQQRIDALNRQIRFYQTALETQRRDANRNVELVSFLSAPSLRVIDLKATSEGHAASGRALVTDRGLSFYASSLPPLAPGRTYQLWLMKNTGNAVVSGGLLLPGTQQNASLTLNDPRLVAGITALAITDEPAGGVPAPTGPKILFGFSRAAA